MMKGEPGFRVRYGMAAGRHRHTMVHVAVLVPLSCVVVMLIACFDSLARESREIS